MDSLTLHGLRNTDPHLHDLLMESCGGRAALASVLLVGIAEIVAERATKHERERCAAHCTLAEASRGRGWELAAEFIRSGLSSVDAHDAYMQAADERRCAKPTLVAVGSAAKEGA